MQATDHFGQRLKTNPVLSSQRCEDLVAIKNKNMKSYGDSRVSKEQGTESRDRFPEGTKRLNYQS
ncbi:MAG TPA: hypothetical protein DD473_10070 [Planctomycetaceae bacterium]|nr:hypothetical protein [Planctomycetaceae bacterium]